MAGNSKRDIIQIESTAGTGYRYSITKNKRLHPDKIEYKRIEHGIPMEIAQIAKSN